MKNGTVDLKHLACQMYATDEPLRVRIRTHELYTQPRVDLMRWVLEHAPWSGNETVLDVGSGTGAYAEPVRARLTRGGRLLGMDLSIGMLRELLASDLPADLVLAADATCVPLANHSCDVVLANHVLYHVPDIERAVREAHRVLRPGGRLLAATNGRDSMSRFVEELESACHAIGVDIGIPRSPITRRFTVENGRSFLAPVFAEVECDMFSSALVFQDTRPAVDYVKSLRHGYEPALPAELSWQTLMAQVEKQIGAVVKSTGEYRVPKVTGVFVATRRCRT